jgi:DNA-directed RNA polymerase subunit K/omega
MKTKFTSRGPQIDTDVCVKMAGGNRFNMILIGSVRAREIRQKNKESDNFEHTHPVVTALLEIQDGKVGVEQLDKLRKKK